MAGVPGVAFQQSHGYLSIALAHIFLEITYSPSDIPADWVLLFPFIWAWLRELLTLSSPYRVSLLTACPFSRLCSAWMLKHISFFVQTGGVISDIAYLFKLTYMVCFIKLSPHCPTYTYRTCQNYQLDPRTWALASESFFHSYMAGLMKLPGFPRLHVAWCLKGFPFAAHIWPYMS